MKRWKMFLSRQAIWAAVFSTVLSLAYATHSLAQSPAGEHYVTMSERIGKLIVLYRAFDVWIYVFQGILLFIGVGFTIYYMVLFHKASFLTGSRKRVGELRQSVDMQAAIDFEMTRLSEKFLFLELMIGAAPVAGLLGTIVGLVQVFSEQTIVEHVTMQSIAGGMYVAMVTTVCGLIVALIGIVGRHFLNTRLAELREILAGAE